MADNYTVTYSEVSKGFPSFYSYNPEWMIGMNNYFYSFNQGNLYRHNVNPLRNTYYGVYQASTITSVFNEIATVNKIFKTIQLEGDDRWAATFATDLQTGEIQKDWLIEKESDWFGFIRYFDPNPAAPGQFFMRSVNGIGTIDTVTNIGGTNELLTFTAGVEVGTLISVGDVLYSSTILTPTTMGPPVLRGEVIAHSTTPNANTVTIDTSTPAGGSVPPAGNTDLAMYVKNSMAESHGVLGHYCEFTLTNDNTEPVELFSVKSDVMKSYP